MGLEILKTAIDEGRSQEPITEAEALQKQASDLLALKVVVQDAQGAEAYVQSKQLPTEWEKINSLYRAYVAPKNWPNSTQPRAHLGMPLILEAIENILAQTFMAFFSAPQPFALNAVGKTSPKAARATSKILCWALKMAKAKEEIRKILKSILEYGQGVGKWGWQLATHDAVEYKKDDTGKVTRHPSKEEISQPTLEYVELTNLLVDPKLRNHDIRNAGFVIHQMWTDADGLQDLAEQGYQNIPTLEELALILAASGNSEPATDSMAGTKSGTYHTNQAAAQDEAVSAHPFTHPLELLEHWTPERVITVLQRKIVIRNEENEFGRLPFVSCSFVDVLGAFFGFGVGRLLEGEQRFQQGVVNAWIDGLSLSLNPMYHRKKGVGAASQNINSAPGKVVNDDGELSPLPVQNNTPEALTALASSEQRATRRVAANFGNEMPTQAMRTAEGVNSFSAGIQVRLQYFVEQFADLVFIPILEAFIQLSKDNLQPKQISVILTQEEGKDYEGDPLEIYNGQYALECLSSTKLAARRAMAALIPTLMQMFAAEPVQTSLLSQSKKVDYAEFVQQAIDMTGWPATGLIVDAKPEDIQRAMMMNPAVISAQSKQAELETDHQNQMELEEEKATGRAGNQVVRHLLDQSAPKIDTIAGPLVQGMIANSPLAPPEPGQVPFQSPGEAPKGTPPAPRGGTQVEGAPPPKGQV